MNIMLLSPIGILKHYRPLCFIDEKRLLISKRNQLFYLDLLTQKISRITEEPSLKQALGGYSKLVTRLLRLGFHTGILYQNNVFLAYNKAIFRLNTTTATLHFDSAIARGSRPLNFTTIQGIEGFDEGVYYGEYFSNHAKTSVHILKKQEAEWVKVFTFEENEIEHIHNIIPDPIRNVVWILTGDFEQGAAIWLARNNFTDVQPIVRGTQQFRACVAFPTTEGLIYGTDSQFEQNYIRLLRQDNTGKWKSEALHKVNGSVIYGCKVQNQFVFSTAVEPAAVNDSFFDKYLSNQRGQGIIENRSEIVLINADFTSTTICQNPKDVYPFGLFQFGAITFPAGHNPCNHLFAFNIGLENNDQSAAIYDINDAIFS